MARQFAGLLWCMVACGTGEQAVVTDTDVFRPDHPRETIRTTHIAADLVGTWEVRVPQVLDRKVAILKAGIDGAPADFDPPLSEAERIWYEQAGDPEHAYVAWYRCSQKCRFEIKDSSIWNWGYNPYSRVGSGLMSRPVIEGREVEVQLTDHDPNGMSGRIKLRMNREWNAFRVIDFELDGFRDPHLGQKLELYYERAKPTGE